jgi:exopolyphosphatase/guanosine-5'-triphosphate,3'-diphosphate pyrophosphatase
MKRRNDPMPETVAAVDLGSNSFHMIVARSDESGELQVVDRLREMVRLASGLDGDRNLTAKAQAKALACLERFGQRVGSLPRGAVRAVGTNTLRQARNSGQFIREAEAALGHPIQTIAGVEEARLIYRGVTHSLGEPSGRRLVIDIGGGSTEVIIGDRTPRLLDSLYLGCVSSTLNFFPDGFLTSAAWDQASEAALSEFKPIQRRYRKLGWDEAVGASGTISSVHAVLHAQGWSSGAITRKSLLRLRDVILQSQHIDALWFEGLSNQRQPVFVGGVVVLLAAFESLKIDKLEPSDGALREGLLHDLLGRIRHEDVREAAVRGLADRYHVDHEHAECVKSTALELLTSVNDEWGLSEDEEWQWLAWAADLHEVGLEIAHSNYHKHGQYIIAESDLAGFSRDEQTRLAMLVRMHRRKLPLQEMESMRRKDRRTLERLALIFRIAVILHRSRNHDPLSTPNIRVEKKRISLEFPDRWLDENPLTRADLRKEAASLAETDYELEFT